MSHIEAKRAGPDAIYAYACRAVCLLWFGSHCVSCVTSHVPRVVSESFGLPLDIHLLLIHDDVAMMFDTTQHDMLILKNCLPFSNVTALLSFVAKLQLTC